MLSNIYSLLARTCTVSSRRTSAISATARKLENVDTVSFRTTNSYPPEHKDYLNQIYTVPSDVSALLQNDFPTELKKQSAVFRELTILIRKPAIEVMSYLEQTDFTKPIQKYVLYGKLGTGKTMTLIHLIHYGLAKQFIVIHLPWVCTWFRFAKQVQQSPLDPEKLDLPLEATAWLQYFKNLNQLTMSTCDLKVSNEYTWSPREITKCGEPLCDLIEFGIKRSKFACGVISALIDELKIASTAGKCKTLVAIDGFNAFTSSCTLLKDENRKKLSPEKISITPAFMKCMDYNWCNGAVILTVDQRASKDRRESEYPLHLLGRKGFELLDPFIPVHVEDYSKEELNTIFEYYKDRKWIRNISLQGQRELELLTNRNPFEFWTVCRPL